MSPARVALAVLLLVPIPCSAEGLAAYDLAETAWNGLSSFAVLAEFGGYEIEQVEHVDLDELNAGEDVLIVVHPTSELDSAPMAHWIATGGTALIADDFGSGDVLLEPFALTRGESLYQGGEVLDANPYLPLVAPLGEHGLSAGVRRLAMNHPASIRGDGRPVFAFDDGSGAVYDMSLGVGRAILLADPSLLTNLMLPIAGNRTFVLNSLRTVCPAGECRLVVLAGSGNIVGSVESEPAIDTNSVASALERFKERLRNLRVAPRVLHFAAVLLALGSVQLLLTLFPRKRPAWLDARIRARRVKPLSEFEFNLARYGGARRESNLTAPASLLKERFEARFYGSIGQKVPPADADVRVFGQAITKFARRYDPKMTARAKNAYVKTLTTLHAVPTRDAWLVVRAPWIDDKSLLTLQKHVSSLLEKAGLNDEFESDVRRPNANS